MVTDNTIDHALGVTGLTLPVWLVWLSTVHDYAIIITPIVALILIVLRIVVAVRDLFHKDQKSNDI